MKEIVYRCDVCGRIVSFDDYVEPIMFRDSSLDESRCNYFPIDSTGCVPFKEIYLCPVCKSRFEKSVLEIKRQVVYIVKDLKESQSTQDNS